MPSQKDPLPFVDSSRMDDGTSFVSTAASESALYNDTESIAPLIDGPKYSTSHIAAPNQPGNNPSDKIIMTSIPVPVNPVAGSTASSPPAAPASKSRFSFSRARGPKTKLKIVLLPQSEYDRFFARDKRTGAYLGTEPERAWTEQELDERYAQYKSALPPAPMQVGSALKDGGGWGSIGSAGAGAIG